MIFPRHWEDEARKCGYSADRMMAHIRDILARLPDEAASLLAACKAERITGETLDALTGLMARRVRDLTGTYGAEAMAREQDRLPGL